VKTIAVMAVLLGMCGCVSDNKPDSTSSRLSSAIDETMALEGDQSELIREQSAVIREMRQSPCDVEKVIAIHRQRIGELSDSINKHADAVHNIAESTAH